MTPCDNCDKTDNPVNRVVNPAWEGVSFLCVGCEKELTGFWRDRDVRQVWKDERGTRKRKLKTNGTMVGLDLPGLTTHRKL
jgi:hypothetical protein